MKKVSLFIQLIIILLVFLAIKDIRLTGKVFENSANLEIELPENYKEVAPGSRILFTTKLLNFEDLGRRDIILEYSISNDKNEIIIKESETLAIETQASFVGNILLPDSIKPGKYSLMVNLIENSTNQVKAEESFYIINEKTNKNKIYIIASILSIIAVISVFFGRILIKELSLRIKINRVIKEYYKNS